MKLIKKHFNYIKHLASKDSDIRNSIIKLADKEVICAVCECILNVINGNIKIKESLRKKISPHKDSLRKLQKKSSLKVKKKILTQKGGNFLPLILPVILNILGKKLFKI